MRRFALLAFLAIQLAAADPAAAAAAAAIDDTELALRGSRLDDAQIAILVARVAAHADDRAARMQLVGKHFLSHRADLATHVLWFIRNAPEADIVGQPFCALDHILEPAAYAEGAQAWKELAGRPNPSAAILKHAASYFGIAEPPRAVVLLERGMKAFPRNRDFPTELANLHEREHADPQVILALRERAADGADAEARFYLVDDLAKAAFNAGDLVKARAYAEEALRTAAKVDDWNAGNAVFCGHTMLGRIALQHGDLDTACAELLAAGRTKGSPQLDSFGPNMTLARDLLARGRKDAVVAFFDLCAVFWKVAKLQQWRDQIAAGATPDFGPNLDY